MKDNLEQVVNWNKAYESPFEYWVSVISLLSSQIQNSLRPKEIEALAWGMVYGNDYPFYGKSRKFIMKKLNITDQTITMHKTAILKKQLLTTDGKIVPVLQKLRVGKVVSINVRFHLIEEEKN